MESDNTTKHREPWNKGKLVGQKAPLKPKEIWAIPVRLQMDVRTRDLALFNLGIDSQLRACGQVRSVEKLEGAAEFPSAVSSIASFPANRRTGRSKLFPITAVLS
jgi:hypothetical protein